MGFLKGSPETVFEFLVCHWHKSFSGGGGSSGLTRLSNESETARSRASMEIFHAPLCEVLYRLGSD